MVRSHEDHFRQSSKGSGTEKVRESLEKLSNGKKTSITRKKATETGPWRNGELGHAGPIGQQKLFGFYCKCYGEITEGFENIGTTVLLLQYCL